MIHILIFFLSAIFYCNAEIQNKVYVCTLSIVVFDVNVLISLIKVMEWIK